MSYRESKEIYEFGQFRVNVDEHIFERLDGLSNQPLADKAFNTLVFLIRNKGRLVAKQDLLNGVWGDAFVEENSVNKAIHAIRRALSDTPDAPLYVETVRKHGYRFIADVVTAGRVKDLQLAGSRVSEVGLGASSVTDSIVNNEDHEVPGSPVREPSANWPRRSVGAVLLLTAAMLVAYLFIPHAFSPIADVAATSDSPEYRPLASAEDAYLKGLFYFDSATNAAKIADKIALFSKSISELEKAVSIDPRYADALASLARTYHWLGSHSDKPEAYVKSKIAALAAIELDPTNAKAHASLAWVYWRLDWDWVRAEAEYKQGLSKNSADPLRHGYALFISAQGRHDEAIDIMRQYEASSPLNMSGKFNSALIKLRARRYDAAEMDFRRILELDPERDTALSGLAITLTCQERYDEAIVVARRTQGNYENSAHRLTLAWVLARAGRTRDAIELVSKAEQQFDRGQSTNVALAIAKVYAGLADHDKAFEWLEKAFTMRSQYLVFLAVSPEFDTLSGDPRFAAMLKRVGLRS